MHILYSFLIHPQAPYYTHAPKTTKRKQYKRLISTLPPNLIYNPDHNKNPPAKESPSTRPWPKNNDLQDTKEPIAFHTRPTSMRNVLPQNTITLRRILKHIPTIPRYALKRFLKSFRVILLFHAECGDICHLSDEDEVDPIWVFAESGLY